MAYTKYSLTPANNNAAPPDGAPEGMLPSAVNDTMRDMMAQIRDCGDGIRDGTYTMTAPKITGGTITGATFTGNTFSNPIVTGVSTFAAGTVSAPAITTTGDTNTGIFFPAADTIAFTEGGVESMRIDSSGNVGIGTTSPNSAGTGRALTINSASTTAGTILELNGGGTRQGYVFSNSTNVILCSVQSVPLLFSTNDTERMRITSGGDVGVGTTSPKSVGNYRFITTNATTGSGYTTYVNGTEASNFYANTGATVVQEVRALPLVFETNATERMRITSGGNVLVGTTTAGLKLTVQDGVTIVSGDQSGCRLVLQNTTSPGRTFSFVAGTVGVGNDNFTIYDNTAAATRVTLNAGGEFIIGTTDQGAYNLQCNGTGVWGAGAYVNGSDERIKDDIEPLESSLDVVAKLNPVTYKYKEDWSKDQSTQTGFIAQELLTALEGKNYVDGVVQQGGSAGYYSVAYQNIIPILTKAIQEQQAMIEELKQEVAKLKGN